MAGYGPEASRRSHGIARSRKGAQRSAPELHMFFFWRFSRSAGQALMACLGSLGKLDATSLFLRGVFFPLESRRLSLKHHRGQESCTSRSRFSDGNPSTGTP